MHKKSIFNFYHPVVFIDTDKHIRRIDGRKTTAHQ